MHLSSHLVVLSTDSFILSKSLSCWSSADTTSSRHMIISEWIAYWVLIDSSGVRRSLYEFIGEVNQTPYSVNSVRSSKDTI